MHPPEVGELVEVPVLAGQQVARRHAGRALLAATFGRAAATGAADVLELRLVGLVRVGVGIGEGAQRRQPVAAGAPKPLGEHQRRNTEIAALVTERTLRGLVREGTQLGDLLPELAAYGRQQLGRMDVGDAVAALPDAIPCVEARGHHGEAWQVHDRAGTVGEQQRAGPPRPHLGVVLLDPGLLERLSVAERVEAVVAADEVGHVSPPPGRGTPRQGRFRAVRGRAGPGSGRPAG